MKKHFPTLSLLVLFGCLVACNNEANKDSVEKADSANEKKADSSENVMAMDEESSSFMVKATDGGMMEVVLGKLAQQKATNKRVKNFGAMMVEDHSKANDELKGLAREKNVTMPDSLSENHHTNVEDMRKKPAKEFDKAYMKMMVDDHQEDIDEFEKASKNTKNADLKAWIDKTLPVLRKHLDSAKTINSALK